ncbi:ABC-three component system protein [Motiliproteus sp.]|uniref:ABC-three component system protein n=1 Tax=Motiliproteus sp. TaxID=1898955 RepID=UPI003BACD3AC
MKYNYSEISHNQFEELVLQLCFELFGLGTQKFSDGVDGGRDARFDGIANELPSRRNPWEGLTVIQAKHTIEYNKKYSDNDFFGADSSVLNQEVSKIKKLIANDDMKNYILFANRKLPAQSNENILNFLSLETGLNKSNLMLVGVELMESWLKVFPSIPEKVDLNAFDMPLNIEPDELAEVILKIKSELVNIDELVKNKRKTEIDDIKRTTFKRKNELNNVRESYANIIEKKIIAFDQINDFLSRPENYLFQEKYEDCKDELDERIKSFRNNDHDFEKILENIYDLIIKRDQDCKTNKRLTKAMLHYMYYMCDIGEVDFTGDSRAAYSK